MGKYVKVDPERLEIVERCCICGRLFFKATYNQKACNLWPRPGKKQSACVYERAYMDARHRDKSQKRKRRKNRKITGRPRQHRRETVKTPSGCKLVQADGRCQKWNSCANKAQCLRVIPPRWKGFKSYNSCPGYEKDERVQLGTNNDYDYDTAWEVGF